MSVDLSRVPMSHGKIRAALEDSMHNIEADPAYLARILSETKDAARVLPQLMRLLRRSRPHVRSKVAKMIGRGGHRVKWVLHEADPRVRANAIEALWGVDTPQSRALLRLATNDSDNRVLGNAILGLYYLGECAVLEQLIKLSADAPAGFRATAAWVMGQTGDARFREIVRGLRQDSAPIVRRRALTALTRIGRSNARPSQNPHLHIAGRMLDTATLTAQRRILAAVASDHQKEPLKLTPVQFVFSEGTRYITSYRVVERPGPDAFSEVWVIPRMAESDFRLVADALRQCLKWKRPNDLWWVLLDKRSAQFTADDAKIEALLQAPPKDVQCDDIAVTISRASQEGRSRGERHVFVLGQPCGDEAALWPADVRVVSHELICQAYLGPMERYEITYRPASAFPVPVRLRVQTPEGWTETVLPASDLPLPIHRQTHHGTNR